MRARCVHSLLVYASAIGACKNSRTVDLQAALEIYADMQRCAFRVTLGGADASQGGSRKGNPDMRLRFESWRAGF